MRHMSLNVWLLTFAGALGMCVAPMVVFIGGIVGVALAPKSTWSTLPVAAQVIGTAVAVLPVSRLMQAFGRKRVFIVNALFSAASAIGASLAITYHSFWGFTFCVALMGASLAVIQQYRFAAMESVVPEHVASAASFVLLGGLVAAFLGPELAHWGQGMLAVDFAGSFALLAIVSLLSIAVLVFFKPAVSQTLAVSKSSGRPLPQIMRQPVVWVAIMAAGVGYAVMSYIMTATPVSMHTMQGHSLLDTKWVIQSHICAMFLPSFFSGKLVDVFGAQKIMWAGLLIYAACMVVALAGQDLMHYWLGLVLLGLGWNFLFVAGTALLSQSYRHEERFKVQGLNDFVVFGSQAVAALSSGVVIYSFGWDMLILIALPLLAVQIGFILNWRRAERVMA